MTSLAPTRSAGAAPARAVPDLSFLLDRTSHVLRTRMSAALAEVGMTPRMHCVLVKALEQERTQAQIAELGDMDKTTMVVTVDALETAGLAVRPLLAIETDAGCARAGLPEALVEAQPALGRIEARYQHPAFHVARHHQAIALAVSGQPVRHGEMRIEDQPRNLHRLLGMTDV